MAVGVYALMGSGPGFILLPLRILAGFSASTGFPEYSTVALAARILDIFSSVGLYNLSGAMGESAVCGALGSLAAGEIIKYLGARPMAKLAPLVEKC